MQADISFGRFRLDLMNECLWEGKRAIALRPKAFAVLKLLAEHPGQLMRKQQVLDAVWPGTFVGDAVLKDSVRQLREALDDDAESPVHIETAHRRGYRFIGTIPEVTSPKPAMSDHSDAPKWAPEMTAPMSSTVATTILGREAELIMTHNSLDRALFGERQIVFITGEPGIGKTTIVQAFLERVSKIPGILMAHGQCLEHYGCSFDRYLGSGAHLVKMTEKSLRRRKLQNPPPELYVCDLIRRSEISNRLAGLRANEQYHQMCARAYIALQATDMGEEKFFKLGNILGFRSANIKHYSLHASLGKSKGCPQVQKPCCDLKARRLWRRKRCRKK